MLTDEEREYCKQEIGTGHYGDALAQWCLRLDAELAVLRAAGYAVTTMKESGKDKRLVAYILEGSPAHGEEAKTDAIISENARLHAQLAAMGKMLKRLEWCDDLCCDSDTGHPSSLGTNVTNACPICGGYKERGHRPGCELAALLRPAAQGEVQGR